MGSIHADGLGSRLKTRFKKKQINADVHPRRLTWILKIAIFEITRDPGSPSENGFVEPINTTRFGGDLTPLAHHLRM